MHQPMYREPGSRRLLLPWVRLHALKDYLDMPLMAAAHENVRVTFNLVPSLLDQLDLYLHGGTDSHLELTRVPAQQLRKDQKVEILSSFFDCHIKNMIEPHPRFAGLYNKVQDSFHEHEGVFAELFSSEEMRDLQVWSNLTWIDPLFRNEEPIASLFAKGRQYTEEDKLALIDWQLQHIAKIVPTHKKLLDERRIDVSFTPYYHPILPLLCDTNAAREAIPDITLPQTHFQHPEDAEAQIRKSQEKYLALFGRAMEGMWPSEGSVSEQVAEICSKQGLSWIASDEEVLSHSLRKSGMDVSPHFQHSPYQLPSGLKMFFRNHQLSDRIGFVYSGWDAQRAADDFVQTLLRIREGRLAQLEETVVPIILDGENAWEYFPNDGREFLEAFYHRLSEEPLLNCTTMSEASHRVPPVQLPKLFAGSWIGHNFRIWIGHPEDNRAWDLLSEARQALADAEKTGSLTADQRTAAWEQVYIAEGSDWCWWYGDEHRGTHNAAFDLIFRRHVAAIYHAIGQHPPDHLDDPIFQAREAAKLQLPEGLITPNIDGRISTFYEWAGCGQLFANGGGAMHRVDRIIDGIAFGYDADWLYLRLDFLDLDILKSITDLKFQFALTGEKPHTITLSAHAGNEEKAEYRIAFEKVVELAIRRDLLWKDAHGEVAIEAAVLSGGEKLDVCPGLEPLMFTVPALHQEIFWPV